MNRLTWIIVMWAMTAVAQVSSFRPLSKPEVSRLLTRARSGNADSQLKLGMAFQYGMGVEADAKTAEYWLKIAAGFGDPEAQTQLGLLYLQPGFEASREQSLRWFMRAASGGSARAEHNLGLMYTLGIGVNKDREQAIHWYRRAAQHGLGASRANLGVLLVNSIDSEKQVEGFRMVTEAANDGNADAENALGYCYQFGAGTKVDLAKSVEWYKRAAAHGNLLAMHNLGDMYRTGVGVDRNLAEALRWYSHGCDSGERSSCVSMANAFLHGEGTARNDVAAYEFALRAGVRAEEIEALEKQLPEEARNRAAEEAERWKQAHAMQLSASPH
jgi:TPR repeat protein